MLTDVLAKHSAGILVSLVVLLGTSRADTLLTVPAYEWSYGCAPTAAAMLLGYWDTHGFPNLFNVPSPDIYQTQNVTQDIAQLAASMDTQGGWTMLSAIAPGISKFASQHGYSFSS